MISIKKLSEKYLDEASRLANSVFHDEPILPSLPFEASLDEEKLEEFNKIAENKVSSLEYFVAVDEAEKVLGTTGICSREKDENYICWLGWYCVDPKFRGKGVGGKLLDYVIEEAKKRGKKYLRLYTSTNPDEKVAQRIYDSRGFQITGTKKDNKSKFETIYKELKL